jgi:putative phosphoesterase
MSELRNGPGRIWVISDTHLRSGQILPKAFIERVEREDIIIHLGDFVSPELADRLRKLARLEAVCGNCDPPSLKNQFPRSRIIEIEKRRIGLVHGKGGYLETARDAAMTFGGKVDAVLFGHTHAPYHAKHDGIVLFNPGSLTQSRRGPESFGRLHLDSDGIWGEVIEL